MKMKVLSLFDGISCGMVALERAGIPVEKYVAYEIDENAIKIAKHNYTQIEEKGDVFKANYNSADKFDLLIGGSPCTYWSIAKAGNDRETVSSGFGFDLFMQYVRALREVKPTYFLYENNESMSDDIRDAITKELGVQPIMIDSADFSAQIRKRYYWTNIPIAAYNKKYLTINDIIYDNSYKVKSFEKYENTKKLSKDGNSVKWDSSGKGYYSQQCRARKPTQKMNTVTSRGVDKCNIWLGDCLYRHIHPIEAERLQTLPDNYTDVIPSAAQRIKHIGNGWTVDVIAHIFKGLGGLK
jgi:DNA (cytosine-5)-methyltransferase 3A